MNNDECFFGVNFADGRIKCYPTRPGKGYFTIYVRGDPYGENRFSDNGDGTITDEATGLMWTKSDNREGVLWEDALAYCEGLELAGYDDWRLPNAKELQSIVDYSRSPDTTDSAAIDSVFETTLITNELGQKDYAFYWTGTTHVRCLTWEKTLPTFHSEGRWATCRISEDGSISMEQGCREAIQR